MKRRGRACVGALAWIGAVGCASPPPAAAPPSTAAYAPPAVVAPPPVVDAIAPAPPDVELHEKDTFVGATGLGFDGIEEGLAWPALAKAVPPKAQIVIAVERTVPVKTVLRAVWTLRQSDIRVQTPDASGAVHVIDLAPKPAQSAKGCHLAVFVGDDGALRVAAPGGPRILAGSADVAGDLAASLDAERGTCPIRYAGFGAERPTATWGSVFDVAWAVARGKSAGDARLVLAEPVHGAPTPTR